MLLLGMELFLIITGVLLFDATVPNNVIILLNGGMLGFPEWLQIYGGVLTFLFMITVAARTEYARVKVPLAKKQVIQELAAKLNLKMRDHEEGLRKEVIRELAAKLDSKLINK